MVCPKFISHVYKLKRQAIGEYICFYFATRGLKRWFHWGVLHVPNFFDDGSMNMDLSKNKIKFMSAPMN
jgi:hypothetical protein